jgi:RNA polymerase sigma factor (sigma-70 family)
MVTVLKARNGDHHALEAIFTAMQDRIYNLALRMLGNPQDAEDASQEILIKVVTHLSEFRGDAAFSTWVYRIAWNHLLHARQQDQGEINFDPLGGRLQASLAAGELPIPEQYEQKRLIAEVRISCIIAMLLCLDPDHRSAYILAEVLGASSDEAAYILGITSVAYRKRLSRARQAIQEFVGVQCGLVNPDSPCRCHKHVGTKIALRLMNPDALQYMKAPLDAQAYYDELYELGATASLFRKLPEFQSPARLHDALKQILNDHLTRHRDWEQSPGQG